jgi:hypothetical protein
MRRHAPLPISALAGLCLLVAAPAFGTGGGKAAPAAAPSPTPSAPVETGTAVPETQTITMHVGIPGLVYLGQPLEELLKKFPKAQVFPFAGQDNAATVRMPQEGISCLAVGEPPDGLRVASIGFNFETRYEGIGTGSFRTAKGIGRGSTLNDLVDRYGTPSEVIDERRISPLRRRQQEDPNTPKKHLYKNDDGSVSTYFVVQRGMVLRMTINENTPLDRYIVKGGRTE